MKAADPATITAGKCTRASIVSGLDDWTFGKHKSLLHANQDVCLMVTQRSAVVQSKMRNDGAT
jgi:hypothetical protein